MPVQTKQTHRDNDSEIDGMTGDTTAELPEIHPHSVHTQHERCLEYVALTVLLLDQ